MGRVSNTTVTWKVINGGKNKKRKEREERI
jgi:hypothetical protein